MPDGSTTAFEQKAIGVSVAIADFLCRTRLTYEGHSTWLGTNQIPDASGATRFAHGSIGPALYGGVSGIALFLAETGAKTGNDEFGAVAVSAISHAMSRMNSISPRTRFGFFSGEAGIAYAAHRIGVLQGRTDLVRKARRILGQLARESTAGSVLDVISGAAGSAPFIAGLANETGDETMKRFAHRLGRRVLAAARKTDRHWSWGANAVGFQTERHLTGFAHGTAGFGWSLLELHRELGDTAFERGARQAFRYERGWFQKSRMNWPDFRETRDATSAPCRVAWCHGAPGIGMSRLAAWHGHDDPRYRGEIVAAIRSSRVALRDGPEQTDYSLCHGMLGVAEFVLMASELSDARGPARVALDAVSHVADQYGDRPDEWPCGLSGGRNPSLMVGLAGIGYFYLRLAFADVPSVLLPGRALDGPHSAIQRRARRVRASRAESTAQRSPGSA